VHSKDGGNSDRPSESLREDAIGSGERLDHQDESTTGDTHQQRLARLGVVQDPTSEPESPPHPYDENGRKWMEKHPPANDDGPRLSSRPDEPR
jgi:hypothetical protein